jgi:hypothetical protein
MKESLIFFLLKIDFLKNPFVKCFKIQELPETTLTALSFKQMHQHKS